MRTSPRGEDVILALLRKSFRFLSSSSIPNISPLGAVYKVYPIFTTPRWVILMWCSALSPPALASKTSCPFVTHACNISFSGSITHYLGSNSHPMHPEFNSGKANIWIVRCRCAAADCSRFYLLNYRLFNDSFSISHLSFPFQFKFQFFLTLPTSLAAHLDTISDILEPNRLSLRAIALHGIYESNFYFINFRYWYKLQLQLAFLYNMTYLEDLE